MDDQLERMMAMDEAATSSPSAEQPADTPVPAVEVETREAQPEANVTTINKDGLISVSEVLLGNTDKCVNTTIRNASLSFGECDLTNYIVYTDDNKKIPCVYDCSNLYFDKTDVLDSNNNTLITSIEGRRSGFVIHCTGHDIVMSKNFIYKCDLNAAGNITAVYEYGRIKKDCVRKEKLFTDITPTDQYDAAILYTAEFLRKVPKKLEDKTIEGLRTEIKKQYAEVNDINAVINIIKLRVEIGC